jgi:hypothetical protein
MISEWILLGGYFYETKDGLPYIGNIPIFQVLILFWVLVETASHFQLLEWNLFLKC